MAVIQSIERAFTLLEHLGSSDSAGLSLQELSEHSALKPPTCHNILGTLIYLGYVRQDSGSRRYVLSDKSFFGGERLWLQQLAERALSPMQALVREFSETFILCVYYRGQRKTLLALEPQQALRVSANEGEDRNFFSTATGRMLFAMLPDLERKLLQRHCGNWVSLWPELAKSEAPAKFLQDMVDSQAYYYDKSPDIEALAVPLFFEPQKMSGAIGVYFPRLRHKSGEYAHIFKRMQEAGAEIRRNET